MYEPQIHRKISEIRLNCIFQWFNQGQAKWMFLTEEILKTDNSLFCSIDLRRITS